MTRQYYCNIIIARAGGGRRGEREGRPAELRGVARAVGANVATAPPHESRTGIHTARVTVARPNTAIHTHTHTHSRHTAAARVSNTRALGASSDPAGKAAREPRGAAGHTPGRRRAHGSPPHSRRRPHVCSRATGRQYSQAHHTRGPQRRKGARTHRPAATPRGVHWPGGLVRLRSAFGGCHGQFKRVAPSVGTVCRAGPPAAAVRRLGGVINAQQYIAPTAYNSHSGSMAGAAAACA